MKNDKTLNNLVDEIKARLLEHHVVVAIISSKIALELSCEMLFNLSSSLKLSGGAVRDYSKRLWDARVLIDKYCEEIRSGNFQPSLPEEIEIMKGIESFANTIGELGIIYAGNL